MPSVRILILILTFSLMGCFDPTDYIFPVKKQVTVSATSNVASGRYNPLPTEVEITLPTTVSMDSVSKDDFSISDTCVSGTVTINTAVVAAQVVTVTLGSTTSCVNGESFTLSLNYKNIEMTDDETRATGSKTFTYTFDNVGVTVSAALGGRTGITASGNFFFATEPTSVVFTFSSDVDLDSVTASDFSITSRGTDCSVMPTLGTLSKNTTAKTVTIPLTGGTCNDGEGYIIKVEQDSINDLTQDGSTLTAQPNTAPVADIEINLMISSTAPEVTSVGDGATSADATFAFGSTIDIAIKFSTSVDVTGTPRLRLGLTGTQYATYTSGSGSDELIFQYVVASGVSTSALDYQSTTSLQLNSGAISLASSGNGVPATLTLATPGTANSLSANRSLVIDGTQPTVVSVSPSGTTNTWSGDGRDIEVTMSEGLDASSVSDADLTITAGTCSSGAPTVSAAVLSGASNNIITFTLSTNTCANGETYTLSFDPADVTDVATNPGTGAIRSILVTTDISKPVIAVGPPSKTHINSSGSLTYTVTFTGAAAITLASGDVNFGGSGTGCTAAISGSGLSTRTITISDCSDNGAVQIDLAAGIATTSFGNASDAVAEGDITDFDADNTPLTDPTDNLPSVSVNKIYNLTTHSNFVLTFSGDTLGAQAAVASAFDLSCNAGGGGNPVSMTVTRISATEVTIAPSEVSPDFVYGSTCTLNGTNIPDAAGNVFSMTAVTFKVSDNPGAVSGPSGTVSLSTATSDGNLGSVTMNVAMDTSTMTSSNATLACDGQDISLTDLTPSGGDKVYLIDFDESDSDWTNLVGGESCTLTFTTSMANSLGEALAAPVNFNFTLSP